MRLKDNELFQAWGFLYFSPLNSISLPGQIFNSPLTDPRSIILRDNKVGQIIIQELAPSTSQLNLNPAYQVLFLVIIN